MAGFSSTTGGLNFQYPNRDTTNWDAVMANTFTTISEHNHDRDTAGKGAALTDRSILADNTGWFQSLDFAGSGTVNLIRATTSDTLELGAPTLISGALTLSTPLAVDQGGHGATTAAGARTNLGLDTMATQAASAVAITGGTAALTTTSGGNLQLSANTLLSTDTNGDTIVDTDGTGEVSLRTGGNEAININTNGIITQPLQPAFHVEGTGSINNVTGDGTSVTVPFNSEIADRNSDFASNTFTAPATGLYRLSLIVTLGGIASNHTLQLRVVTSNINYEVERLALGPLDVGTFYFTSHCILVSMDAADTAFIQVQVGGGVKDVDIVGSGGGGELFFSGTLEV